MFKKSMRIAHIVTPFLSVLFAACSLEQASEEEVAAELATSEGDGQTIEQGLSGHTWGITDFEFCVSKNFGVTSCPAFVGLPCSAPGAKTVCKKPGPEEGCLNIGLGLFEVTCQ